MRVAVAPRRKLRHIVGEARWPWQEMVSCQGPDLSWKTRARATKPQGMTDPTYKRPTNDAIAHRELQVRIALDNADIDAANFETAAALLSIAIDAFRLDTKENLIELISGLHDVVQQKAAPPRRGENSCCEHVARGTAAATGETVVQFKGQDGGTVYVLARLCAECLRMTSSVPLVQDPEP